MNQESKKVLVAEDEEVIRQLYVTLFERMGFAVVSAENGEEAYHLYQQERPDLLLTDSNMPLVDGLDLIKQIRQGGDDLPVIMVSGRWDRNEQIQEELNFTYMSKPVDVPRFINLVKQRLSEPVPSHA